MHPLPPPVQVTLAESRFERAWIAGLALATVAVVLALSLEPWLGACAAGLPLAWAGWRWRAVTRRRASAAVRVCVGLDRSVRLEGIDGRTVEGRVLPASYVGAALTTVVWRRSGARVSRAFWIVPDMLPRDDFRRLRVALRYGQSGVTQESERNHA